MTTRLTTSAWNELNAEYMVDTVLKADHFGRVERVHSSGTQRDTEAIPELAYCVRRDLTAAVWSLRWLARFLGRREAIALIHLKDLDGVASLVAWHSNGLLRTWLEGEPMQVAQPRSPTWYAAAFRLLRQLHLRGLVHNDLAKEPNWLVLADGSPGLVDFQLAKVYPKRGWLFRLAAREDIRHLLKHKRTYCSGSLTERELKILATPSWASRVWRQTGKRFYLLVTRGLLGWADREGAGDRKSAKGLD